MYPKKICISAKNMYTDMVAILGLVLSRLTKILKSAAMSVKMYDTPETH